MRLFFFLRRPRSENTEPLPERGALSEQRQDEIFAVPRARIIPASFHGFAEISPEDERLNPPSLEGELRAQYEALDVSLGDCIEENFLFIEPLTTLLMEHLKNEDEHGHLGAEGALEEALFVESARLFGELISTKARVDTRENGSAEIGRRDDSKSAPRHTDDHALAAPFEKLSLNEPGLMLRHGTASDLTAALALATVQRLYGRSTGCFINTETMKVLGAICIDGLGARADVGEDAELIGSFRERQLTEFGAATEQMRRRFRERPAIYARDAEGLHLAVDVKYMRQLSLLSHEYLEGSWYYMPFREGERGV